MDKKLQPNLHQYADRKFEIQKNFFSRVAHFISNTNANWLVVATAAIAGAMFIFPIVMTGVAIGLVGGLALGNKIGKTANNITVECPDCKKKFDIYILS